MGRFHHQYHYRAYWGEDPAEIARIKALGETLAALTVKTRTINALIRAGYRTIGEVRRDLGGLEGVHNLGERGLLQLRRALATATPSHADEAGCWDAFLARVPVV